MFNNLNPKTMKTKFLTERSQFNQYFGLLSVFCLSKPIIFLSLLQMIFLNHLLAQTSNPPTDAYVTLDSESAIIYLEILDTTSVSEIHVILSSKQNESDIFENTFLFDQTNGLPGSMSYSRSGNGISLGTGQIAICPVIFTKIRLKNSANNWSEWLEFVSN